LHINKKKEYELVFSADENETTKANLERHKHPTSAKSNSNQTCRQRVAIEEEAVQEKANKWQRLFIDRASLWIKNLHGNFKGGPW
jgi:hypothetical protein